VKGTLKHSGVRDNETVRPNYGELLTAHEALELTYRFRVALSRDVLFAQVLIRYLTFEDLAVFETFIGLADHLGSNPSSEAEAAQYDYIRAVSQTIVGRSRATLMVMGAEDKLERLERIKKTSLQRGKGNERKWSGSRIS